MKENNFPIGYINVSMEENHDFGYGLRKEFWHKGIVTEAGKAVVEQVKNEIFEMGIEVKTTVLVWDKNNLINRWKNDNKCEWRTQEWLDISLKSLLFSPL